MYGFKILNPYANIIMSSIIFKTYRRILSATIAITFIFSMALPPGISYAQIFPQTILQLPAPGTMIKPTPGYVPVLLKGIRIQPSDPLKFDFMIDSGHTDMNEEELKEESSKLIKYFLASVTVPEEDMWVNLSPYEKDRIIPEKFGQTEMGRDLLAQDYILKQLTASLIYPEEELGKKFWKRVYAKAKRLYGTTDIPFDTFNKVWVVPEKAKVYENGDLAYVVKARMKVMLENDYLAAQSSDQWSVISGRKNLQDDLITDHRSLTTKIVRELIVPELEREVNEGQHFAQLRQIYHSMILATWYKRNLKTSILNQQYVGANKIKGIETEDKNIKEKIYQQYLEAFKQGAFNYIKEDYDSETDEIIPRKYFSGGMKFGTVSSSVFKSIPESLREIKNIISRGIGNIYNILGRYDMQVMSIESILPSADPSTQIYASSPMNEESKRQQPISSPVSEGAISPRRQDLRNYLTSLKGLIPDTRESLSSQFKISLAVIDREVGLSNVTLTSSKIGEGRKALRAYLLSNIGKEIPENRETLSIIYGVGKPKVSENLKEYRVKSPEKTIPGAEMSTNRLNLRKYFMSKKKGSTLSETVNQLMNQFKVSRSVLSQEQIINGVKLKRKEGSGRKPKLATLRKRDESKEKDRKISREAITHLSVQFHPEDVALEKYLPLIQSMSRSYSRSIISRDSHIFEGAGILGLKATLRKYPEHHPEFEKQLKLNIRREIIQQMRDEGIGQRQMINIKAVEAAKERLIARGDGTFTLEDLSVESGLDKKGIWSLVYDPQIAILLTNGFDQQDPMEEWRDQYYSKQYNTIPFEQIFVKREIFSILEEYGYRLTPRELYILKEIAKNGEEIDYKSLADQLNVSAEQIMNLIQSGILKLRLAIDQVYIWITFRKIVNQTLIKYYHQFTENERHMLNTYFRDAKTYRRAVRGRKELGIHQRKNGRVYISGLKKVEKLLNGKSMASLQTSSPSATPHQGALSLTSKSLTTSSPVGLHDRALRELKRQRQYDVLLNKAKSIFEISDSADDDRTKRALERTIRSLETIDGKEGTFAVNIYSIIHAFLHQFKMRGFSDPKTYEVFEFITGTAVEHRDEIRERPPYVSLMEGFSQKVIFPYFEKSGNIIDEFTRYQELAQGVNNTFFPQRLTNELEGSVFAGYLDMLINPLNDYLLRSQATEELIRISQLPEGPLKLLFINSEKVRIRSVKANITYEIDRINHTVIEITYDSNQRVQFTVNLENLDQLRFYIDDGHGKMDLRTYFDPTNLFNKTRELSILNELFKNNFFVEHNEETKNYHFFNLYGDRVAEHSITSSPIGDKLTPGLEKVMRPNVAKQAIIENLEGDKIVVVGQDYGSAELQFIADVIRMTAERNKDFTVALALDMRAKTTIDLMLSENSGWTIEEGSKKIRQQFFTDYPQMDKILTTFFTTIKENDVKVILIGRGFGANIYTDEPYYRDYVVAIGRELSVIDGAVLALVPHIWARRRAIPSYLAQLDIPYYSLNLGVDRTIFDSFERKSPLLRFPEDLSSFQWAFRRMEYYDGFVVMDRNTLAKLEQSWEVLPEDSYPPLSFGNANIGEGITNYEQASFAMEVLSSFILTPTDKIVGSDFVLTLKERLKFHPGDGVGIEGITYEGKSLLLRQSPIHGFRFRPRYEKDLGIYRINDSTITLKTPDGIFRIRQRPTVGEFLDPFIFYAERIDEVNDTDGQYEFLSYYDQQKRAYIQWVEEMTGGQKESKIYIFYDDDVLSFFGLSEFEADEILTNLGMSLHWPAKRNGYDERYYDGYTVKSLKQNTPSSSPIGTGDNRSTMSYAPLLTSDENKPLLDRKGGIDLNANQLDIETQGKGVDFDIPISLEILQNIPLQGLSPVIYQIIPVTNFNLLLGLDDREDSNEISRNSTTQPFFAKERYFLKEIEEVSLVACS